MEQIWKEVPHYPGYRVSNFGKFQSCKRRIQDDKVNRISWVLDFGNWQDVTFEVNRYNRPVFCVWHEAKRKRFQPGNLVLTLFLGPCPEGLECCHNDGNAWNNHIDNLRWDTHQANMDDMLKHGVRPLGTKHWKAKINEDIVREIRELAKQGISQSKIGKTFGIKRENARDVIKGKTWSHVI